MSRDVEYFQHRANWGKLTTQAFLSLSIRLLRTSSSPLGLQKDLDVWASEVISEIRSTSCSGAAVPTTMDISAINDAVATVEDQFNEWRKQLAEAQK